MKTLKIFLAGKPCNTARCYKRAIMDFVHWLWKHKKRRRYVKATARDAAEYLTRMIGSSASATVSNRHGALTAYYTYLEALGDIEKNPFQLAKALIPRRQRKQVRPTATIPPAKVRGIMDMPDGRTPEGIRDRAILSALFGGGLRRSELLAITLGDIQVTPGGELVLELPRTKAGEAQHQIIKGRFAERICELVACRKAQGARNCDKLFEMSESTLYRLFREYCRKAGIKAAPHAARAAAITNLLERGIRLDDVKRFARHASFHTIELYDHRALNVESSVQPNFFGNCKNKGLT